MKQSIADVDTDKIFQGNQAALKEELTGALIGLAHTCSGKPKTKNTDALILEGLAATAENSNLDEKEIRRMIERINEEKNRISPGCRLCASRCGNTDNYDMNQIWNAEPDIRLLKQRILSGIREMAVRILTSGKSEQYGKEEDDFFYKALSILGYDLNREDLLPTVLEIENQNRSSVLSR